MNHNPNTDTRTVTICSNCEREIDAEGEFELEENQGYTGCCNEPTATVTR